MKPRPREQKPAIPPEARWVLQFGKQAYQREPSFEVEPNELCWEIYKLCGVVIRDRDAGKRLWAKYRGELLKRADVKTFWAYREYEKKRSKPV
jgi:hypothetical protein